MVTDPIADLIVRIKNASDVKKSVISLPYSKIKKSIAHVLEKGGYLTSVEEKGKKIDKTLEIGLSYIQGEPRVHGVLRISKPSRRVYLKASDIRVFKSGYGNTILSTPKGILLDMEARKLKVGGEVLFRIW